MLVCIVCNSWTICEKYKEDDGAGWSTFDVERIKCKMKVRDIWTSIEDESWSVGVGKEGEGNIAAIKDFKGDMCKY